jgi:hypothetical protein
VEEAAEYRAPGWSIALGAVLCLVPLVGAIYGAVLINRGDARGKILFGLALFVLCAGLLARTAIR